MFETLNKFNKSWLKRSNPRSFKVWELKL